jgi:hypothetical protein
MKKFLQLLIFSNLLLGNSLELIEDGVKIIKGEKVISTITESSQILKVAKLSKVTEQILSNTKVTNIQNLLHLAVKEQRVSFTKQFLYIKTFKNIQNGDRLLLQCLKNSACDLANYSSLMNKSPLHITLASKYPTLTLAQINNKVGAINETLMNKYFKSTGWTKIEGEVGRNGIDGLFIKRKNGVVSDVIIAESKYNKSGLQHTQHGKQMTNQWILKKLEVLQAKYPKNLDYKIIEQHVKNDNYRALLWNLKTTENKLLISLTKIHDKNGAISTSALKGNEKMKINFFRNRDIDIQNPQNSFQEKVISWYKVEI